MARDLSEPPRELRLVVTPEEGGMRLDHWLGKRLCWRSRTEMQKRVGDGRILVEDEPSRKSRRLFAGETVRIRIDEGPATEEIPLDAIRLDILYEDPWIVVLDKPSGVIVHPVGPNVMNTLLNALHLHYRERGEDTRPMIVHRLDKDTSGVLVLAKDSETRKILGRDFEGRRVKKTYLALVNGGPKSEGGVIDLPIGPDKESGIRVKMACRKDGKPSRTEWEVVERHARLTAIRCRPLTGRQHQIRLHLASLGTPILADWLYGQPPPVLAADLLDGTQAPGEILLDRMALHAEALTFDHPATGEPMTVRAPFAGDLVEVVMRADGARRG